MGLDLHPRPLWPGESPTRGDLHFKVGFAAGAPVVSQIIAAGTASRVCHVGIITAVFSNEWVIAEALSNGFVSKIHSPPPVSTVIRLSDDAEVREMIAASAQERLHPLIKYDWWTIARLAWLGLVGRIPFVVFGITVGPWIARWIPQAWQVTVTLTGVSIVLYVARNRLYNLALRVPFPDSPRRMICSEVSRRVIEDVFGADALPGLVGRSAAMTSPGDLLQALLGRTDYGTYLPKASSTPSPA
jgi:hypothetical protein